MRRSASALALIALAAACAKAEREEAPAAGAPAAEASSLKKPNPQELAQPAPDTVRIRFETSKGPFVVEAYRAWSPQGVDRLYHLARLHYYDGVRFFRVLDGFMAQFGINGDPEVTTVWRDMTIPDDPVSNSNKRGTITFATRGPNTRTTQLFINFVDNPNLDGMGFTPIGRVVEGMEIVDSFYKEYGEGAPGGAGPDQGRLNAEGNAYLAKDFPKLDSIVTARVVQK
jgi:peptidyl-prolyl cis-trans isomerase A (cyclophilin A)